MGQAIEIMHSIDATLDCMLDHVLVGPTKDQDALYNEVKQLLSVNGFTTWDFPRPSIHRPAESSPRAYCVHQRASSRRRPVGANHEQKDIQHLVRIADQTAASACLLACGSERQPSKRGPSLCAISDIMFAVSAELSSL